MPNFLLTDGLIAYMLKFQFGNMPNILDRTKGGYRMGSTGTDFAACLRMYRAKADITQTELAEMVGVDAQSVINWEKGVYMPSLRTTVKLADALGVSIDQLAGR